MHMVLHIKHCETFERKRYSNNLSIKTHDSESRGQEEAATTE